MPRQNDSLKLFNELKLSYMMTKEISKATKDRMHYKSNDKSQVINKFNSFSKGPNYGSFIAPKIIEFAPANISVPIRIPIIYSKYDQLNMYKAKA